MLGFLLDLSRQNLDEGEAQAQVSSGLSVWKMLIVAILNCCGHYDCALYKLGVQMGDIVVQNC